VADKGVLFIRGLAVEATLPEGIKREALFESDSVVLTDVRVQTGGGAKSMRVRTVSIDAISEPEVVVASLGTLGLFIDMNQDITDPPLG